MADNSTQVDVIINMLLKGEGAKLSKEQIDAATKAAEQLGSALQKVKQAEESLGKAQPGKSPTADIDAKMAAVDKAFAKQRVMEEAERERKLQADLKALEKFEQEKEKALARHAQEQAKPKPVAPVVKQQVEKVAEEASASLGEKLQEGVEKALVGAVGRMAGIPGITNLFSAGGLLGAGIAGGIAAIEKGIDVVITKFAELQERAKATEQLALQLRSAQMFSPQAVRDLSDVAGHLSDANANTTQWLGSLTQLARAGADPATVKGLSGDVKALAQLMGGDMPGATAAMASALQGNFEAMRQVNIVVDTNLSGMAALEDIHRQVSLRISEFGNAAVSSVPQVRELAAVSKGVADEVGGIAKASDEATAALGRMVAQIEQAKGDELQRIGLEEKLELAKVERAFGQGSISKEEATKRRTEIQQQFAGRRFGAEQAASDRIIAEQTREFEDANTVLMANGEEIRQQEQRAAKARELEDKSGGMQKWRDRIGRLDEFIEAQKKSPVPQTDEAERERAELLEKLRRGEAAIAEQQRLGIGSAAVEQQRLNDMRAAFPASDDAQVERMEKARRAIEEEERKKREREGRFGIEGNIRGVEGATAASAARDEAQKRLDAEARSFSKRAAEAREKGLPEPEMPASLQGRSWEYDVREDKVRWLNSVQQMKQDMRAAAVSLEELGGLMGEVRRAAAVAVSRAKNDGGLVG